MLQVAFATVLDLSRLTWRDRAAVYRLHGVALHVGTYMTSRSQSHYLAQYVREAAGQWFEYDDAKGTAVSAVTTEPCFLECIMHHAAAGLMLAVRCMLCVAQAIAACAALLTTKVTTTCIAAAVCICCCMQCCKTILSEPSLFKVLSTCINLCCSLGFATLEYLSCLRHVPKVNPVNMLPLADSVCLCMVTDCLIKTMNAAAISGPCASLACQLMLGLQVTEAFVLSLPVYLLMYRVVMSSMPWHSSRLGLPETSHLVHTLQCQPDMPQSSVPQLQLLLQRSGTSLMFAAAALP